MKFKYSLFLIGFFLLMSSISPLYANEGQPVSQEANIVEILEEKSLETGEIYYQKLKILIIDGEFAEKEYVAENGGDELREIKLNQYQVNDRVVVFQSKDNQGNTSFYITDYVRRSSLFWLTVLFLLVAFLVGNWKSFSSLLGLFISFVVILKFIIPQISLGHDPVIITIIGSMIILPATFYLSHGINNKTSIALLGTLVSIIITGILSVLFINLGRLSGFNSEEVGILSALTEGTINMEGLLLSGIIIGTLGVLDDITVSQAAIVFQLKEATKGKISFQEIFTRSMEIGKDHIASMINTLFLVYAGASLPLLLLFADNPRPFTELINYEPIATEVVRTLIGSIGLILAVPLTTMFSFLFLKNKSY